MVPQKYFIKLAYQGTHYHGWQRQAQVSSVQQTIEEAMVKIFKRPISIHGCGRTDTGVHATGYFAQVILDKNFDFDVVQRLNLTLPDDIVIYELIPVRDQDNVQYSALDRTYQYHFHTQKNPLIHHQSTWYPLLKVNESLIRECLDKMVGNRDFRAFCIRPDQYPDTHCQMKNAQLVANDAPGSYYLEFTANRFLQRMIRLLVARLLEVSNDRLSSEVFINAILQQQPFEYKNPAPPQGLRLWQVHYPFL